MNQPKMEEQSGNEVVMMLDKLDQMLDTSDKKRHSEDPVVQEMLHEQHNLIRELGKKFKYSVHKGVAMEARNANLLNENEALQLEVTEERQRVAQIQKKLQHLEETVATFSKIKEEYEELTLSLKEGVMSFQKINVSEKPETEEKATTSVGLIPTAESGIQTVLPIDCSKCSSEGQHPISTEPTIVLTQSDLARLDDDMKALKDSLKDRDKSWQKMEKRDKMQRAKICRLDTELGTMKETANNRKQELENKAILIKNLESQIKKMQDLSNIKIKKPLKKVATKKRLNASSKSPPPLTTSVAHPPSPGGEGGVDRPTTPTELPAKPVASRRPLNKSTAASPSRPSVSSALSVPSHVLTSDSRLRGPSASRARENLARSPVRDSHHPKKRNRSRLTRPHANTSVSPQRSLNIRLKDGQSRF